MYSIIIVDDESRIRDSIKGLIPWNEYGFNIIGFAENGLEALDLIEEKAPDVIITDIRMPYMDGIELIKELRKTSPTTSIVILSGHDEFSYAQTAIKYNVTEYVLKPVSKNDIIDLLKNIKIKLDNEISLRTDKERLNKIYNNLIPAIKEKTINEIYLGNYNGMIKQAEEYGLPVYYNYYMTCLIEPEINDDIELNLLTIKDILKNHFDSKNNIIQSIINNKMILTFYYSLKGQESIEKPLFKKRTLKQIQEISQFIHFYTKSKCNIGISKIVNDIKDLNIAYKECIQAINYKAYYKDQNIFFIEDLEPISLIEATENLQDDYIENLISSIKLGSEEDIDQAVDLLFSKDSNYNPLEVESYVMKILSLLTNLALSYNINLSKYLGLINKISSVNTINTVIPQIKEISIKINQKIQEKRESSNIKFVEEAKKLIEQNYQDKNFNQDVICDTLGVSNAYFSSTFKKETKTPFTKALTQTRIEHAKNLIKKEVLKTYQIAERVGFSDSNYFSFCFKKITGDSPSTYKQKIKE
ncbi:MAG: response regulator [Pleomorphochaeta sp.]